MTTTEQPEGKPTPEELTQAQLAAREEANRKLAARVAEVNEIKKLMMPGNIAGNQENINRVTRKMAVQGDLVDLHPPTQYGGHR